MSLRAYLVAPAQAGAVLRIPQPVAMFAAAPASAGATDRECAA